MTQAETRFKRFLNCSRENAFYTAGHCPSCLYEPSRLPSLDSLIADGQLAEVVAHIVKAHSDGYSTHPNAIIFALALCTKQKNQAIKKAAYNAIKMICSDPQDLFLFVNFSEALSKPHTGWGRGLRQAVQQWYNQKKPQELAEIVTRYRGRHGWTHRDLLKLTHPVAENIALSAIFKYIIRGLEEATKEFGDKEEAQPLLSYLQAVEEFKHCQDYQQAARLIEIHSLSLEHIPTPMLTSREVWMAVIQHLPLRVLLQNLKRLSHLGFLQPGFPLANMVIDALSNETALSDSKLHPAEIYIVMNEYELQGMSSVRMQDAQKVSSTATKKHQKKLPKPNPKVIESLDHLLMSSFKLLTPTGLRYMVAVDVRNTMTYIKCWQCSSVTGSEAATIIIFSLLAAESEVYVTAFSSKDMVVVSLNKGCTLLEAQKKFRETPMGQVDLVKPLQWAQNNKKAVDMFVIVTENQVKATGAAVSGALQQYREVMELPNTKLVVCALGLQKFSLANPDDVGMLDIAGFDGNVPRVIEAFARGVF